MSSDSISPILRLETYLAQVRLWPQTGRHILAQFDDQSIVVYQAYRPSIGKWAAEHGQLGGPDFSENRMTWIKPNFLWMMYRSGWGTKENQEVTLALRLRRTFFEEILADAVESAYSAHCYDSPAAWEAAVRRSSVRVQWDPDHDPRGRNQERRAIQLGLRGRMLRRLANEAVIEIRDISDYVAEQRAHLPADLAQLQTPRERVYIPADAETSRRLGIAVAMDNQELT